MSKNRKERKRMTSFVERISALDGFRNWKDKRVYMKMEALGFKLTRNGAGNISSAEILKWPEIEGVDMNRATR